MNTLKKYALVLGAVAMLGSSANSLSADCGNGECGVGYQDCCSAPTISPTLVLGALVVGGLIAVIAHKKSQGHSDNHGGGMQGDALGHGHSHG